MERSASQDFDDLIIRRRPLYPTELRGLIQKIFNFAELQDSNDSIFRRRTLYPAELQTHIVKSRGDRRRWELLPVRGRTPCHPAPRRGCRKYCNPREEDCQRRRKEKVVEKACIRYFESI